MRKMTFQVEILISETENGPATAFAEDIYDAMSNEWVFGDGTATVAVVKDETI